VLQSDAPPAGRGQVGAAGHWLCVDPGGSGTDAQGVRGLVPPPRVREGGRRRYGGTPERMVTFDWYRKEHWRQTGRNFDPALSRAQGSRPPGRERGASRPGRVPRFPEVATGSRPPRQTTRRSRGAREHESGGSRARDGTVTPPRRGPVPTPRRRRTSRGP